MLTSQPDRFPYFILSQEKVRYNMINLGKFSTNGKEVILEEKENGCQECISHCKDDCGYTRIMIKGKHERLFRIIFEREYGKIPSDMVIRHKCDNPSCCNLKHLEIGTQKDNVKDMMIRNRSSKGKPKIAIRGSKNKSSKLKEDEVIEIYNSNLSGRKLAKQYNVSRSTIQHIKKQTDWKWLTQQNF